MATFVLLMLVSLTLIFSCCNRGVRLPGPSWFDIPYESNRAARRARQ